MSASTWLSQTGNDGSVTIGLALASDFSRPATCFGPTYDGNNTLTSSSGSYVLSVGFNSACSAPGANITGMRIGDYTTLAYYLGSCPSAYTTVEGAIQLYLNGAASTAAICCPPGESTGYERFGRYGNVYIDNILLSGSAFGCSSFATAPVTVIRDSSTQILPTATVVVIVESPIVVLQQSSYPAFSGITYTSTSTSSFSGVAQTSFTILDIVPSSTVEFSLPSSCLAPTFNVGASGYDEYISITGNDDDDPGLTVLSRGALSCYPDGYYLQGITVLGIALSISTSYATFYYPGTCPPGFSMASPNAWTQSGADQSFTAFSGGWCCPSDWTVTGPNERGYYLCVTEAPVPITLLDTHTTWTLDSSNISFITYGAFGVASSSQVIGFGDAATPGATASMPTRTGAATDQAGSSDLSSGAAAGIGVGVTIGVLLVCLVALLFWRRRKRSKTTVPASNDGTEKGQTDQTIAKAELPGGDREAAIFEVSGKSVPAEVGDNVRAELEGDAAHEAPGDTLNASR